MLWGTIETITIFLFEKNPNVMHPSAHVLYIYLQGNDGDGAAMHRQCGVDDRISVILRLSSNISMSVFESIKISWGNEKLASELEWDVFVFTFHN